MLVKSNSRCSTQISRIKGFRLLGIISFRLSFLGAFGCARWWDGCVGDGAGRRSCLEDTSVLLAPGCTACPMLALRCRRSGTRQKRDKGRPQSSAAPGFALQVGTRVLVLAQGRVRPVLPKGLTFLSQGCCGRGCSMRPAS